MRVRGAGATARRRPPLRRHVLWTGLRRRPRRPRRPPLPRLRRPRRRGRVARGRRRPPAGPAPNHQLVELGARLGSCTRTAARYRLFALATDPPKPGLVRTGEGERGGGVEVEEWRLSPAAFAAFVAAVPPPLAIGQVELADGRTAPGFVCTPDALAGAVDITDLGGWRAYLRSR
ncbi:MAG: hypothetical protein ACKVWR_08280 [Acidimicrobiales bacterium]